jgi:hypothetical protein
MVDGDPVDRLLNVRTLETSAAAVKAAANRVAKALSSELVTPSVIMKKQGTLEKNILVEDLDKYNKANKELSTSLNVLDKLLSDFVLAQNPAEGAFLAGHTAYTQVLGDLIQNNNAGLVGNRIEISDTKLNKLLKPDAKLGSPLSLATASTVRNMAVSFAKTVELAIKEALKENGTLWAWGEGDGGALGNGYTAIVSSPVQVGNASNWASASLFLSLTYSFVASAASWVSFFMV